MKRLIICAFCAFCVTMTVPAQKYVGGDISMLPKFIEKGAIYNDKDGNNVEPLKFFAQQGWNTMRVRLFVDPSKASEEDKKIGAIQDLDYVVAQCKELKTAGFKIMLDFHYSDTWTHPGQHGTPSAWSTLSVADLTTRIYTYTKESLQTLKDNGIVLDFIQTGNEINDGMLWPTGNIFDGGSWTNFAAYIANAIKACNEVYPQAKTIVHAAMNAPGYLPTFYKTLNTNLDTYEVKYDIIGLSYYPDYHGTIANFDTALKNVESQIANKDIMIVETGYGFEWKLKDAESQYINQYPYTEEGQKQFTNALIEKLADHTRVIGLFWWYPEYTLNNIVFKNGNEDWSKDFTSGYWNAALFHYKTGKALAALYELKNFLGDPSGIEAINREPVTVNQHAWYTLDGRKLAEQPSAKGIYIHNGKKIIK